MIQATPVRIECHGDVALIVIDHPPVNALSLEVRRALLAAVERVGREPDVRAVVLACDGRTFVAGADVFTERLTREAIGPALKAGR